MLDNEVEKSHKTHILENKQLNNWLAVPNLRLALEKLFSR